MHDVIARIPTTEEIEERIEEAEKDLLRHMDFFERIVALEDTFSERDREIFEVARNHAHNRVRFALTLWSDRVTEFEALIDYECERLT